MIRTFTLSFISTVVFGALTLALIFSGIPMFSYADGECTPYSTTIVSDTADMVVGEGPAVAIVPVGAWTASIPGSTTWIWKASPTADNETVAFEKSFSVTGSTLLATLEIASDNMHTVFIDGVEVASSTDLNNFQLGTQDTYDLTANITSGMHTLRIEVTNNGSFDPEINPAGLLYKLSVDSELCDNDTYVKNKNSAFVLNGITIGSNTGGNSSNGGKGGSGGSGGGIFGADDDNVGGNGGNGGVGGNGGTITTGAASSTGYVDNFININDVFIDRCLCAGGSDGDDTVKNKSFAMVAGALLIGGNTGLNGTDGGKGGEGGKGGKIQGPEILAEVDQEPEEDAPSADNNMGGHGGQGANGGLGGSVNTAPASSAAAVFSTINFNTTVIRR